MAMQMLVKLFVSFALIGIGAYGGGLVVIPLIQHELVVRQNWLTFGEMSQLLAVAQMTPGPIAINAATFVGYRLAGGMGAIIATMAVVLPSLAILVFVAPLADRIGRNKRLGPLREGLHMGVLSLILFATWSYGRGAITCWRELAIGVAAFLALVVFEGKLNPVWVMLICGLAGLIVL